MTRHLRTSKIYKRVTDLSWSGISLSTQSSFSFATLSDTDAVSDEKTIAHKESFGHMMIYRKQRYVDDSVDCVLRY